MIHNKSLWIAAGLLVAAGAGAAVGATFAQEPQDAAAAMPKPGPEHEILKKDEGSWKATVKSWMAPGTEPMEFVGVETNKVGLGGLWMTTDFKTEDGSFVGHGVSGWDAMKKKYVSIWVDNASMSLGVMHGTWDKDKKMFSFQGEQPDMAAGKMLKARQTVEYPDANTRVMKNYVTAPGGTESMNLEVRYTRAK
jgi:hypothetical protein